MADVKRKDERVEKRGEVMEEYRDETQEGGGCDQQTEKWTQPANTWISNG